MAPEEALSIATLTFKSFKEALPVLAMVGVGGLFFFGWIRAGSAHFLRERIWALLGGSKEFHDTYLNEQWKKVRDLETARYRTGIRFQSRKNAAHTFAWLDAYDVPLDDLLKSARYFDPVEIIVKNPHIKARGVASLFATGLLLMMMAASIVFGLSKFALLTVKKTDTTVWTDGVTVKSWGLRFLDINVDNCREGVAPIDDEHDKKVICELVTSSDSKNFIDKSLKSQKYVGGLLAILLMFFVVVVLRSFDRAVAAQRVYERTRTHQPRQLDLDLS